MHLIEMRLDGKHIPPKQMSEPKGTSTALDVLGYHTSRVELFFTHDAIAATARNDRYQRETFRFAVQMTAADYSKATQLNWQLQGFNSADGAAMARELGRQRLEELKEIYLYQNDLRDAGVVALAPGLTRKQMPKLCQLHLGKNRIGDQGAAALASQCDLHLMVLSLHSNEIGDAGCNALGEAISTGNFDADKIDFHTNQRITPAGREALSMLVSTTLNFDAPLELDYGTPFIPRQLTADRYIPGPMGDDK